MTHPVNKRIALHAKEWTTQINVALPYVDRLSSGERAAFEYITNIFSNPSPDFELLFSHRETLHTTAMEIHDRFGAALRCVAAKTVLIKRDFEAFRNAIDELSDIKTADSAESEIEGPKTVGADIALRMIQRIEYENGNWYEGYLDSDGRWHGEGKYYDSYRCGTLYGTFVHGRFPAYGKFIDSFDGIYEGEIIQKKNGFRLYGNGRYTTFDNYVFESDKIALHPTGKRAKLYFDFDATVKVLLPDGTIFNGRSYQLHYALGEITLPDGRTENCDIDFGSHSDEYLFYLKSIRHSTQNLRNSACWAIAVAAPLLTCLTVPGSSYGWILYIIYMASMVSTIKIYSGLGLSSIVSAPVAAAALMIIASIYIAIMASWFYLIGIIPALFFGFTSLMEYYKLHNLSNDALT